MIDLHSHSSASDGVLSPSEAAQYAIEKKLAVWALTDHDTTDGLYDAAKICAKSDSGIIFVPGIEININWTSGEFHLLGLGLQKNSEKLKNIVRYCADCRRNRNLEIVEKMNKDGIEVSLEEIESQFSASQIGRPHFAEFLKKIGKVRRSQEAFDRFLGNGRPYYANHIGADLDAAVEAIKSAAGVPVLAHPLSLHVSWGKMEETIEKIKNHGVEGLEAWHPAARVNEGYKLELLAKKLGMFVTAGSDFHGKSVRADRYLGKTSGERIIDDRFWTEELSPHLNDFDFLRCDWAKNSK